VRHAAIAAALFFCAIDVFGGVSVSRAKRWPLAPGNHIVSVVVGDEFDQPPRPCDSMKTFSFERCSIREAIRRWNSVAFGILEFREVSSPPPTGPYILIRKPRTESERKALPQGFASDGFGNTSPRDNVIFLADVPGAADVIHELGHRVGLLHEHQHCGRGEFIDVSLRTQIKDWFDGQFREACGDEYINSADYDFRSIMHYGALEGDAEGRQMWSLTDKGKERAKAQDIDFFKIGDVKNLSSGDVAALFDLYCEHPGDCPVMTPMKNETSKEPVRANHPVRINQPVPIRTQP
jgi:hypothetical protein